MNLDARLREKPYEGFIHKIFVDDFYKDSCVLSLISSWPILGNTKKPVEPKKEHTKVGSIIEESVFGNCYLQKIFFHPVVSPDIIGDKICLSLIQGADEEISEEGYDYKPFEQYLIKDLTNNQVLIDSKKRYGMCSYGRIRSILRENGRLGNFEVKRTGKGEFDKDIFVYSLRIDGKLHRVIGQKEVNLSRFVGNDVTLSKKVTDHHFNNNYDSTEIETVLTSLRPHNRETFKMDVYDNPDKSNLGLLNVRYY